MVSASFVIGSVPNVTPTADVPSPAAIDSNITEPIIESRIQPTGPPTVTKSDNIPLSTTIDGPIEVTALLLIALFICVFVSPTFSPER